MGSKTGVYKITCLENNKIYIGSSKNIDHRFKVHVQKLENNKHINSHLQSAWNLYTREKFKFEIIESCDEKDLISREQFWMDETKCYDRNIGFNACIKADRPTGYTHDDIARQKMSYAKLGTKQSKETIAKRSEKSKGRKHSEETKKHQSEIKLGSKNPMFGRKLTLEQKTEKVQNMNSVPRWNKGLTIKDDPRLAKLGLAHIGKTPHNAVKCRLINIKTKELWEAESLKKLSCLTPISLPTLQRLKSNRAGKLITNTYRLEIIND